MRSNREVADDGKRADGSAPRPAPPDAGSSAFRLAPEGRLAFPGAHILPAGYRGPLPLVPVAVPSGASVQYLPPVHYPQPPAHYTPSPLLAHAATSPLISVDTTVRPKRKRISPEQLETLVAMFEVSASPTYEVRDAVGRQLDMSNREVQVWCQNRRAKMGRLTLGLTETASPIVAGSSSAGSAATSSSSRSTSMSTASPSICHPSPVEARSPVVWRATSVPSSFQPYARSVVVASRHSASSSTSAADPHRAHLARQHPPSAGASASSLSEARFATGRSSQSPSFHSSPFSPCDMSSSSNSPGSSFQGRSSLLQCSPALTGSTNLSSPGSSLAFQNLFLAPSPTSATPAPSPHTLEKEAIEGMKLLRSPSPLIQLPPILFPLGELPSPRTISFLQPSEAVTTRGDAKLPHVRGWAESIFSPRSELEPAKNLNLRQRSDPTLAQRPDVRREPSRAPTGLGMLEMMPHEIGGVPEEEIDLRKRGNYEAGRRMGDE